MYGLGVMLDIATSKVHVSIQIVVNRCGIRAASQWTQNLIEVSFTYHTVQKFKKMCWVKYIPTVILNGNNIKNLWKTIDSSRRFELC